MAPLEILKPTVSVDSRASLRGCVGWRVTAGFAIALLVLPVLFDLAVSGERGSYRYVAADSFYYLTVARNAATMGRFSFDQERATNGFQPLWQVLLVPVYQVARWAGISDGGFLGIVVVLNLLLVSVALYWIAIVVRERGVLPPLFIVMPVGVLALLISPMWIALGQVGVRAQSAAEGGRPLYATLWSYANGMESSLVLLIYGAIAIVFVRGWHTRSPAHGAAFGLVLAALVLARLDHAPLPLLIVGCLLVAAARRRTAIAPALAATAACGAVVGAYLAFNQIAFGDPLPVSGRLKTSFPHLVDWNLNLLDRTLRGRWPGLGLAARLAQATIPVLAAGVYLLTSRGRRHGASATDVLFALTAVAVIGIGVYNVAFVQFWHQGHWYFPMSSFWMSAVTVRALGRRFWREPVPIPSWCAWALPSSALVLAVFIALGRDPGYHRDFAAFQLEEVPRIRAHYGAERPRLVEYDDGIVAYATGYPAMSGTGLTLDREAVRYFTQKRLFDLAMARGFDRIASIQYFRPPGEMVPKAGEPATSSPALRQWIEFHLGSRALVNYEFLVEYRSESGRFVILRGRPVRGRSSSGARGRGTNERGGPFGLEEGRRRSTGRSARLFRRGSRGLRSRTTSR